MSTRLTVARHLISDCFEQLNPAILGSPKIMWQEIQNSTRAAVLSAVPEKWKLAEEYRDAAEQSKQLLHIPESCGILSPDQIKITRLTALELLHYLRRGQLTSVEVTEAFCARASIAHQLVR